MSDQPNIVVEITDDSEFHCFKLTLNPRAVPLGELSACCGAPVLPFGHSQFVCAACAQKCDVEVPGTGKIEIMLHACTVVDLIHKLSLALAEWQSQTTKQLICEKTGLSEQEAREKGFIR
jgi:hypothetical protein